MIKMSFARQICLAYKRQQERTQAHAQLQEQVQKVQEITAKKNPRKKKVEKELDELKKKIGLVVDKERNIVTHVYNDDNILKNLKDKIGQLERKLDAYIMLSNSSQQRAQAIEEKIKKRMRPRHYELIKSQLRMMEDKYQKIKRMKGIDKERARVLKEKIEELKLKLEKGL